MPKACCASGKFISAPGTATCSVCHTLFHKACVKPVAHDILRTTQSAVALSPCTAPAAFSSGPSLDLQDVHRELTEWMAEMREFRREMSEFRASISNLSERMDTFERRLEAIEQRCHEPTAEVAELQCQVTLLQQELNDRDQDSLLTDLEIGHLPEEKGENVVHAVAVLATRLGVSLEEQDIVFAERVGVAQGAGAAGEAPRCRRVVVRLARRSLRDQMLQGARTRRNLTTNDAGRDPSSIAGPPNSPRMRIFLNERLTRINRQLFHHVREECRELQWKYAWTKKGRVYARQADGKQAYPIRSEDDIKRVFGTSSV